MHATILQCLSCHVSACYTGSKWCLPLFVSTTSSQQCFLNGSTTALYYNILVGGCTFERKAPFTITVQIRGWAYFHGTVYSTYILPRVGLFSGDYTCLCIHFGRLQFKTPVLFYHMSSVEGKRRLSEDVLLADCVNKYLGRLCVTEQ